MNYKLAVRVNKNEKTFKLWKTTMVVGIARWDVFSFWGLHDNCCDA